MQYRPGDPADFDALYEATYPRIFATLSVILRDRQSAEDCAQEAYLRAFRAWPRWKADAPVEAWLHRIALNVAVSYRRRQSLRQLTPFTATHQATSRSRLRHRPGSTWRAPSTSCRPSRRRLSCCAISTATQTARSLARSGFRSARLPHDWPPDAGGWSRG